MTPDILRQLIYNVANAPIRPYPYPHIYVPNVFPTGFYDQLQASIPDPAAMIPIADVRPVRAYRERFVLEIAGPLPDLPEPQGRFWGETAKALQGGDFRRLLLNKFQTYVQRRFAGSGDVRVYDETLLVEDITHYALGPHTDSPSKVITVLFYLPKDESQAHLGTSIYVPKEAGRTCPGGPHYGFDSFDRVATMPFLPNSMFAFVKGDASFHGVEPVQDPDVRRWLLLYDIKAKSVPAAAPPTTAPATAG